MGARAALGPADVDDDVLRAMVAAQLGGPADLVGEPTVTEVAYDIPALTTAGRWWVRGSAQTEDGVRDFAFFVKHVQSWSRSPLFAQVPPEFRDPAARGFPWATEGAVYRSDLADRLPIGLRMPRAYGVHDLDEESYALWLEVVPTAPVVWDQERYRRAAHLLGRLSGSAAVAERADVGDFPFRIATYAEGRFELQILPVLRSDIWQHPALGAFDPELRARLLAAAERVHDLVAEVDALPRATAHGDACPNNLLVTPDRPDGFTLIDFGLWNSLPVGFDLTQLVVGEAQLGRQTAADLGAIESAVLPAYLAGLHAEGRAVDDRVVRRSHAILLFVFAGASSVPFELLEVTPPAELAAIAAERAAIARFSLDLVDATT